MKLYNLKVDTRELSENGEAIIKHNGLEIRIHGALYGDTINCTLQHKSPHKPIAWANLDEIISPGTLHTKPPCPMAAPFNGKCAACPLMHLNYDEQLHFKKTQLLNALKSQKINAFKDLPIHPSPNKLQYRNRTDYIPLKLPNNKIIIGAYQARSHRVVSTLGCKILRYPLDMLAKYIADALNTLKIPIHPEPNALRYISTFANHDQQCLVDLVTNDLNPHFLQPLTEKIASLNFVAGISTSFNDSTGNALRIRPSKVLYKHPYLMEKLNDIYTPLTPHTFTQLNSDITTKIYLTAKQWLPKPKILWDLYCGTAAFGRNLAPNELYGAELSHNSIELAKVASQNDPFKSTFLTINLEKELPNWPTPDAYLLNPPRKGISPIIMHTLKKHPKPILYMSCNPTSYAQNVASLSSEYELIRCEAFDMMPQTLHFETLSLLIPKNQL